jgi:pimeloyl-ACP methyl ester carboxylesterase
MLVNKLHGTSLISDQFLTPLEGASGVATAYRRANQTDNWHPQRLSIFYREASPKDAATLLLLHGFPSSSRMFEPLFARLSDRYHLVAPDYPGFGHSDWPDPKQFDTKADEIAALLREFMTAQK